MKNKLTLPNFGITGPPGAKAPAQYMEAPAGLTHIESASADFRALRSGFSRAG